MSLTSPGEPVRSPAQAVSSPQQEPHRKTAPNRCQAPKGKQTFPEQVWGMLACFRSIHLAIVLLTLLAFATMAGVLLPQEGIIDPLEIKRNFGGNYHLFKAMGFFNVYSSYWFIALEVLFFLNLLNGSFQWLKPAFLAATRKTFCGPEHIQASPHQLGFSTEKPLGVVTRDVTQWLKKYRYRVHTGPNAQRRAKWQDSSILLYACKGNFSRLGPVVAHVGILLMLIASVYGAFFGFKAQKLAVPGETFAIRNAQMFKPNVDESVWLGSVPAWKIRVNDFRIRYYAPGEAPERVTPAKDGAPNPMMTVKQYYADLSLVAPNGKELKRETISVNHPLAQDDTVIYQASFNPTGRLFVEINGKPRKIQTNTQFMNRPVSLTELGNGQTLMVFPFFVQQDPNVTRNYAVFFIRDQHGFVGAKPGHMPPNLRLLEGQSGQLNGMSFTFIRPEIATGLQIKKGPEVPWMYLSYLIIIIGTIMCIFSQRQLWVAITETPDGLRRDVRLLYKTKKARLSFMKELLAMQGDLTAQGFTEGVPEAPSNQTFGPHAADIPSIPAIQPPSEARALAQHR